MTLTTIPKPEPVFLGPDTVLCKGEEITLTTNDAYTIWSNGQNGKSMLVTSAGLYYATVSNQCGIATDSVNVDIEPCDLWFPTAFTPNGDNLNDYARVVGDLKMIRNFSLSIYNRWGERVFHTTDVYAGWDGEYNGAKQGLGTFFYMINYTLQGKSHLLKGDLTLIR
jgi:gliding motility-associated-like protein